MRKLSEPLKAGDQIGGRFTIKRIIGRGGMGVVYLAHDTVKGHPVALKTILPRYRYINRAVARFSREVVALREMKHPSIVQFQQASQDHDHDLVYFTMEYIQGVTLRQHMEKHGPLDLESALTILTELGEALHHVHLSTLHRDVSPENVMITDEGRVKLLDFGLAQVPDPNFAPFTRRDECLGRDKYTPPEQKTDPLSVDKRVDIYALGVLFFELLTGDISKFGTPLCELRPELSPECDKFLAKSTARRKEERFPDAQECLRALRSLRTAGTAVERPTLAAHIAAFLEKILPWRHGLQERSTTA